MLQEQTIKKITDVILPLAYGYDTKGQLLTAVREDSQNTTLNDMDYAYDGIGNRTEAEEDTIAKEYVSNLLNQYTSIETTSETPPVTESPTYDADGNMLTNGPWTYTWNTESRLTTAASGTTVLEFQYDYMGRRIEKTVTENLVVTKHELYVYDGYKLIAIYDALDNNALKMTFVWQPIGLDVPLCMTYGGNTYYYLTDGNKNVTGLFDSTGTRVATYLYGPFGQVLSSTGVMASTNPFRFSSEFYDDETGLVYYNYRYYSPVLGRWTRRDPVGNSFSDNIYAFTRNTVTNLFDLYGLWNEDIHLDATRRWALQLGYSSASANVIAQFDEGVDNIAGEYIETHRDMGGPFICEQARMQDSRRGKPDFTDGFIIDFGRPFHTEEKPDFKKLMAMQASCRIRFD